MYAAGDRDPLEGLSPRQIEAFLEKQGIDPADPLEVRQALLLVLGSRNLGHEPTVHKLKIWAHNIIQHEVAAVSHSLWNLQVHHAAASEPIGQLGRTLAVQYTPSQRHQRLNSAQKRDSGRS